MSRLAVAFALVLAGCSSKKQPLKPPPTADSQAAVTIDVEPPDAAVEIDGASRGIATSLGGRITLTRGVHQIVLSKPGYEVWRGELEVGQTEKLQVKLVPSK